MPGRPNWEKHEGYVRGGELLAELVGDINTAYSALASNRASQYLRRCAVHAIFAFIEAMLECIKVELRSTVRLGLYPKAALSSRDQDTLGTLDLASRSSKFLALDQNIKRTFRLAAKIWHLDFQLTTDGAAFRDFLAAKEARNRLVHPHTLYDIEVTDEDVRCHTVAGAWALDEFQRLMHARGRSLELACTDEELSRLLLGDVYDALHRNA